MKTSLLFSLAIASPLALPRPQFGDFFNQILAPQQSSKPSGPATGKASTSGGAIPVYLTTRDNECIRSGNVNCKPTVGGGLDSGAEGGLTQCGISALTPGIVGLDQMTLSNLSPPRAVPLGVKDSTTRCGQTVMIRLANGKSAKGVVQDRITVETGHGGPQVDISPDIAQQLGLSEKDQTLTQETGATITFV